MTYLPPYTPTAAEASNPELFANTVRQQMCRALGVPATQHSHADVILQSHAQLNKELKSDSPIAQLEFSKVHEVRKTLRGIKSAHLPQSHQNRLID